MSAFETSLMRDSFRVLADMADAGPFEDPRVCFHFDSVEDREADRWGEDAHSVQLARPLFDAQPFELAVDYIGGQVGIEAWEKVIPDAEWVRDRLPRMFEVAKKSGTRFLGWTFEPEKPPIIFQATPGLDVLRVN